MIELFGIATLLYFGLTVFLFIGWKQVPLHLTSSELPRFPFISIVIPVRNEATNIACLLEDIKNQNYPKEKYEVIVVDDCSEDETVEIANTFVKLNPNIFKLIQLDDSKFKSPKKGAITQALKESNGEWIITTDGDCRVQCNWLKSYASLMQSDKVQMITGPVEFFKEKNIFANLQIIEFSALIGAGAATLQMGYPSMCNGANLAFRKSAFQKVNGYQGNEHIASGDDEFLLHKIYDTFSHGVLFVKNHENIVRTSSKATLPEFLSQRKRWAGKWKSHKSMAHKMLAVFIFMYNLMWVVYLGLAILNFVPTWIAAPLLLLKWIGEYVFLYSVFDFFKKPLNLLHFAILQLIYPMYVVFFGIVANIGSYTWKGRRHKP